MTRDDSDPPSQASSSDASDGPAETPSSTQSHSKQPASVSRRPSMTLSDNFDFADSPSRPVRNRRTAAPTRSDSDWECINKFYSERISNNKKEYRCTLCWAKRRKLKICKRVGDLKRHLESKPHSKKRHVCLCFKRYTRKDALKRHKQTGKCKALAKSY